MVVGPLQVAGLAVELEEMRALAEDRLRETEVLSQQIVQLRVDLELAQEKSGERSVASGDITASSTYLSLQAQFSIVQQGRSRAGAGGTAMNVLLNGREQPIEGKCGGAEDTAV